MAEDDYAQVRADWSSAEEAQLRPANAFITQVGGPATPTGEPDGIILTVGLSTPPILLGTPDENRATIQAFAGKGYPVQTEGRFLMTRGRAQELRDLLTTALAQFDEQRGKEFKVVNRA